MALSFHCIVTA